MKKLLSLAVIMLLCCTSFLMFGCSVDNGSMTITLANPAFTISQKTIDEGMDYIDAVDEALKTITIVVDYKDAAGNEKQWTHEKTEQNRLQPVCSYYWRHYLSAAGL